jgi:hypothetical protein
MQLPGGIWNGRERLRGFAFRPVTGELELAILESQARQSCVANQVPEVLLAALEVLADRAPTWDEVHGLCVGDRQFLMRRLGILMGVDGIWLTPRCTQCAQDFDVFLEVSALPVKPAASGFPHTEVQTSLGRCRLRALTGADQEAIASLTTADVARRALLYRSIKALNGEPPANQPLFTEADAQAIEAALENLAPEVVTEVAASCPECQGENRVWVDPYRCLYHPEQQLYRDIHALAWYYHWGEAEILAMPRRRRSRYVDLIDRARGMVT